MFNFFKKKSIKQKVDLMSDHEIEYEVQSKLIDLVFKDRNVSFGDSLRTKEQISFYFTRIVEDEVNNGGFNQLFFNQGEGTVKLSILAFGFLKAIKHQGLIEEVVGVYEKNKEKLEKFNDGTLESFSESYKDNPLNEYDDKFYMLGKEENLHELRVGLVRSSPEEFFVLK